ncbi:MAG: RNA polymerase factor sigma-54 [Bacillota bacterium]
MNIDLKQNTDLRQTQFLSQQMYQSLQVLCLNSTELCEYILAQCNENPLLEMHEPAQDAFVRLDRSAAQDAPELPAVRPLRDLLQEQLSCCARGVSEQVRQGARAIVDCLDEDGYLRMPLEEISRLYRLAPGTEEEALRLVQELDPPGIGARSLEELLWLKACAQQVQDELLRAILKDHLIHVAARRYDKISNALGISKQKAEHYGELIRTLTPYVCAPGGTAQYVTPDIIVEEKDGELSVTVTEAYLPSICVTDAYRDSLGSMNDEERRYVRAHLRGAEQAVRAVQQRHQTLRSVATAIVQAQNGFFLAQSELQPLSAADIAADLGMHASTVSRTVQGKYLQYRRGVLPLKALLPRALPTKQEGFVSTKSVLDRIQEIFTREPSLSDQVVADRLQREGVQIARRTVAKYRTQLGFAKTKGRTRTPM